MLLPVALGSPGTTDNHADACPGHPPDFISLVPLVLTGIGFSIYAAALWPLIAYVVEAKSVGTAFGVVTALQNAGLASSPQIGGAINAATISKDFGYFWVRLLIT